MTFVTIVGYIALAYILYAVSRFAYEHFFLKTDLSKYGPKKGHWALITGAREGVGKGYAFALAKKGFNVVLVARNEDGLKTVAEEIKAKYKVDTKVIAQDCNSEAAATAIVEKVRGLPVSVLVNNVGVNTEFPTLLSETSDKEVAAMLDINVKFTTFFTKAMLPILSQNKSLIVNLSSFTGAIPVAMMAVYSGTKAYVDAFSRALSAELHPSGIDVISVQPHYVVSAMSGFKRANWMVPEGEAFGLATLDQVSSGNYTVSPHWFHDLSTTIASKLPDAFVGNQGFKKMSVVRSKLMKKAAKTN